MHFFAPNCPADERVLRRLLPATRPGARRARLVARAALRDWGSPPPVTERAEHLVAELAANAVLHGRVRGRGFRLGVGLALAPEQRSGVLRVEVTDARGERAPQDRAARRPDAESGRGMLLVAALADRWGCEPFPPGGKTVWAEWRFTAEGRPRS